MPSTLEAFRAAVQALWESTAPPSVGDTGDASGIAYAFVDTLDEETTPGRHRQLVWSRTAQHRYIMEPVGGPGTGQVESVLDVFLSLARDPANVTRTERAFIAAIDVETETLAHALTAAPDLGAGVIEVHLEEIVDDTSSVAPPKPRAGSPRASVGSISRVRFTLRVLHEV